MVKGDVETQLHGSRLFFDDLRIRSSGERRRRSDFITVVGGG